MFGFKNGLSSMRSVATKHVSSEVQWLTDLMLDHHVQVSTRRCECGAAVRAGISLEAACTEHMAEILLPYVDIERLAWDRQLSEQD